MRYVIVMLLVGCAQSPQWSRCDPEAPACPVGFFCLPEGWCTAECNDVMVCETLFGDPIGSDGEATCFRRLVDAGTPRADCFPRTMHHACEIDDDCLDVPPPNENLACVRGLCRSGDIICQVGTCGYEGCGSNEDCPEPSECLGGGGCGVR